MNKNVKGFEAFVNENYNSEVIEEGFMDFMRGGSKEEIEANKEKLMSKLDEIEAKFDILKFKDKANMDKFMDWDRAKIEKMIAKNNWLGSVKAITKGDKTMIIYTPGKKGMNKLAAGSSSQTKGE